jgi:hypothetical protein
MLAVKAAGGLAEAYGRQTPNEAALSWPEIAQLSLEHDPSVHPLAGRIASYLRAEKYQNRIAVGIALNDLRPEPGDWP